MGGKGGGEMMVRCTLMGWMVARLRGRSEVCMQGCIAHLRTGASNHVNGVWEYGKCGEILMGKCKV
jgi:hypothetical protein